MLSILSSRCPCLRLHPFPNSSVVIQSLPPPPSLRMSSAAAPAASMSQGSSFLLLWGLIAKTCAQISPSCTSSVFSLDHQSQTLEFSFNCEPCAQHYDSERAFVPAESLPRCQQSTINIYWVFFKENNQRFWNQTLISNVFRLVSKPLKS